LHWSPLYRGGISGVGGVLCLLGGVLRLFGGVLYLLGGVLRLLGVVLLLRSRHVSRVDAERNWMVGECALGPTRSKSKAQVQGNHPSIRAQIKGIHPLHPKP
jgi:hypothetical protein